MFPQRSSVIYRTPAAPQPPPTKELATNVDYPNLNVADMNERLENLSPSLHESFDSITMNEQQRFTFATNHCEGSKRCGMFISYDQTDHMTVDNADYKLQCNSTVNIVRYANNNVLFIALGDSQLQAWSTYCTGSTPETYCLFFIGKNYTYRTSINQLYVIKSHPQQAVTTSLDNALNVWDISGPDLCSIYCECCANDSKLTGLAVSATAARQLVTCDLGGCARLWDIRASAPTSTCLYDDKTHLLRFTCAAWAAPNELLGDNYVYLGDYDGNVHALDIRVPRKLQQTISYFDKAHVSKLLVNGTHLAVMSNLPAGVKIAKVTDAHDVIYTNENTHDRLTDAVWRDEHTLLTTGHGRKLATHKI